MQRTLLLAKIHNCTLTGANLDYVGSISIDRVLLDAADIVPYEQVQVVNKSNGHRLMTYAIEAPAHSGIVELNGAAARAGIAGDTLIIMTYAQFDRAEIQDHVPTVVIVDRDNKPLQVQQHPEMAVNS
ncbi:MAG: aspartate 1-decarboxylase [Spirulinaceae cyanobacterium]